MPTTSFWLSLITAVAALIGGAAGRGTAALPAGRLPLDSSLAPLCEAADRVRTAMKVRLPTFGVRVRGSTTRPPTRSAQQVDDIVADATGDDKSWVRALSKKGMTVWKRSLPGSPHTYVRGHGVFDAPPKKVIALFEASDAEFIRRYNPMYLTGWDLERYDADTKAAYGKVKAAFPGVRPRDTVSLISRRAVRGGGTAFFQEAMEHPDAPPLRGIVRARIIRGMFLVESVPGDPGKTSFTFTQQIDAGGIVPAWIMNKLITGESISFLQRLERTARTS